MATQKAWYSNTDKSSFERALEGGIAGAMTVHTKMLYSGTKRTSSAYIFAPGTSPFCVVWRDENRLRPGAVTQSVPPPAMGNTASGSHPKEPGKCESASLIHSMLFSDHGESPVLEASTHNFLVLKLYMVRPFSLVGECKLRTKKLWVDASRTGDSPWSLNSTE